MDKPWVTKSRWIANIHYLDWPNAIFDIGENEILVVGRPELLPNIRIEELESSGQFGVYALTIGEHHHNGCSECRGNMYQRGRHEPHCSQSVLNNK